MKKFLIEKSDSNEIFLNFRRRFPEQYILIYVFNNNSKDQLPLAIVTWCVYMTHVSWNIGFLYAALIQWPGTVIYYTWLLSKFSSRSVIRIFIL